MESIAKLKNINKNLGDFSLKNVNLQIQKGYITGIIGKNGAGKTTIIKTLLGMLQPDSGSVSVLGADMAADAGDIKNSIGIVLGNGNFYAGLTLEQMKNIIRRFYKNWDEAAYQGYVQKFGLPRDRKIKELSTGMRAKYNISLALSHHAELVVMDEPSSGLDPVAREELMDLLSEKISAEEFTVIFSTHITSDLDRTADYIILVDNGKILLDRPKDELLDAHRVVKGPVSLMDSTLMEHMVSHKKNSMNFEGLTTEAAALKKAYPGLLFEKPAIEDIMRFYVR